MKGLKLSKKEKIRVSVTMTNAYVEGLNQLVEDGIYLNRGEFILEAIRKLLEEKGVKPFGEMVEKSEESPE